MSLLTVQVLPQGMIFAADKNVTVSFQRGQAVYQAQELGSKILRWPRRKALVGAVGLATIGNQPIYEWLESFIGDHIDFVDSRSVAGDLRDRLQEALGCLDPPQSLIVEFGTFVRQDGFIVPEMWHVTNIHGMNTATGEYDPPTNRFGASEEILGNHLSNIRPENLRQHLASLAAQHNPFWFHQTLNLAVFNTLEARIKDAFRVLQESGVLPVPCSLEDWERHTKMWVLMFGAYYDAFGGPGERYVGGGADVLSIPWPG